MIQFYKKALSSMLFAVSFITLINVIVIYWIPINVPLSSFSAVRIAVVALIEKRYYLILVSGLICAWLFLTTIAIRRQHILLPGLLFLYLMYDFVILLSLFVDGLDDGYWKTYIIQIIVSIALIVLLCIYCWNYLRYILHNRH